MFLRFDNKDKNKNRILLFISSTGIEILQKAEEYHLDGTFKIAPKQFYQILTVHAVIDKITYVLHFLENKSTSTIVKYLFPQKSKKSNSGLRIGFNEKHNIIIPKRNTQRMLVSFHSSNSKICLLEIYVLMDIFCLKFGTSAIYKNEQTIISKDFSKLSKFLPKYHQKFSDMVEITHTYEHNLCDDDQYKDTEEEEEMEKIIEQTISKIKIAKLKNSYKNFDFIDNFRESLKSQENGAILTQVV
ncbi:hypothetical protein BpHYR1_005440 [Brachionus plicatilis]|uniref:Uncharacterized protein n=1 Tax=Brachionus plicatilis TaxID=10195 RepID=A0A3M7Q3U1_BRAPC|nr:hypothetical protein BpHYR1_005440 [Brachionus plicatilis]